MFTFYDRIAAIIFNNDKGVSTIDYQVELDDYEDYFIIRTDFPFDFMSRGWLGDVKFKLCGSSYTENCEPRDMIFDEITYKDVLCVRRIFNKEDRHCIRWQYTFNKY